MAVDKLIEDIADWGHTDIVLKTDGEPAIVAVTEAVIRYHGGNVITENPAKGQKAENGLIEGAGQTVREYVCTFISKIEDGIDDKFPLDSNLHSWVVRWAAICYSRCTVGKDGRTAYERMRGRTW